MEGIRFMIWQLSKKKKKGIHAVSGVSWLVHFAIAHFSATWMYAALVVFALQFLVLFFFFGFVSSAKKMIVV